MTLRTLFTLLALSLLAGGCSMGDDAAEMPPPEVTDKFEPDHFLQFFNKQASLPAGDYFLDVRSASGTINFETTMTLDDGTVASARGQADPTGFIGFVSGSNTAVLRVAGGMDVVMTSSGPACLFLHRDRTVSGSTHVDEIVYRDGDSDPSTVACDTGATPPGLHLPKSRSNDPGYAKAYYATIDRNNDRDTLEKWKTANGFDVGETAHVIFRDTKDLGYGRDMHFRDQGGGKYAFYVNNYVVSDLPGSHYGPLNLDAAIAQTQKYLIGTNAIEFGPIDADGDSTNDDVNFDGAVDAKDFFPRFYNFAPTGPRARRLSVDLDGKGDKAMPVPCIVCHGGRADVLTPNAVNANPDSHFWRNGETLAHLQPFDVGSFEYSAQSPWTRAELEPKLKLINQAIYASYAANASPSYGYAEWDSTLAREMLDSWYGGNISNVAATFDDTYVPTGWIPNGSSIPAGADTFYKDVLATSCRTCHLLRGIDAQSDIDFTTYDKFIGFAARIEDMVFDRGEMPLASLAFLNFHDREARSEALAEFLEANATFSHRAADGSLLLPGRPVARAGPDRTSTSPVAVSGVASLFARTYQWSITSMPGGAIASLDDDTSVRPILTASLDGAYTLSLTVSNGVLTSDPDTVTVTINSSMSPAPAELTFNNDIKPILSSAGCTGCHYPGGGPPIFYGDPAGTTGSDNRKVYNTFRWLADFNDPENSRMILKPTGNHHCGGNVITVGSADYNTFLNWILEGAREN